MADRYIKHIPSGQVFIYQGAYAQREDFEECADVHGNPLGATIEGEAVRVDRSTKRVKKAVVAADDDIDLVLSDEASRGL